MCLPRARVRTVGEPAVPVARLREPVVRGAWLCEEDPVRDLAVLRLGSPSGALTRGLGSSAVAVRECRYDFGIP
ncbi:Uncharacterised protein [Mycobacteroides abscessus subsp. abscessus]|nr:Uncharacterised protein [Mycobacteroides abscessus subsp. abscessus]